MAGKMDGLPVREKDLTEFVGMVHELEILGQIWCRKDSKYGAGALFIPEFGKDLDQKKLKVALKGLLATLEEEDE